MPPFVLNFYDISTSRKPKREKEKEIYCVHFTDLHNTYKYITPEYNTLYTKDKTNKKSMKNKKSKMDRNDTSPYF